jgi:alkyl hydroperoxide reductase subunit AhpC
MKKLLFCLFLAFPIISICQTKEISNFSLKNVNGKMVSLSDYPDAKGFIIIFTCNHCPFAKLYPERLNKLSETYSNLGIPLLAVSSMDTISYEDDTFLLMIQKAKKENFNFPYLYDADQSIAKLFGAQKTPHAFVIWKNKDHFEIKYSGAIDDNGMHPRQVEKEYIRLAVDELLQNRMVTVSETLTIGCQIYFRK